MHDSRQRPLASPRQGGQKPVLPMVQLPIYRVKQRHLEVYLATVYRMDDFDFLMAAGATPGMCVEYLVNPALPPARNAAEDADRIRRGHRTRNVGPILNVLCIDGYIPAGKYIIDTHKRPDPTNVYHSLLLQTRDPLAPECLQFKEEHKGDLQLMDRVKTMDEAAIEQLKRARR